MGDDRALVAILRARLGEAAADASLLEVVRHAVKGLVPWLEPRRDELTRRERVISRTPALRMRNLDKRAGWEDILAEHLADRLGVDMNEDPRPRLAARMGPGAADGGLAQWLAAPAAGGLADLVDEGFRVLGELHSPSPPAEAAHP